MSTRAVPLQAKAVEALDRLRASVNPILFPNARGGRIDFRVFGRRHWRPAQIAAGVEPIRGLYDLRHTYATFALRAGVPVFAVSRFIGSSIAMIDRHYGHLARDSHVHAVSLLDALAVERAVDAAWTSNRRRTDPLANSDSKPQRRRTQRRVDARWMPRLVLVVHTDNEGADRLQRNQPPIAAGEASTTARWVSTRTRRCASSWRPSSQRRPLLESSSLREQGLQRGLLIRRRCSRARGGGERSDAFVLRRPCGR